MNGHTSVYAEPVLSATPDDPDVASSDQIVAAAALPGGTRPWLHLLYRHTQAFALGVVGTDLAPVAGWHGTL